VAKKKNVYEKRQSKKKVNAGAQQVDGGQSNVTFKRGCQGARAKPAALATTARRKRAKERHRTP